MKAEARTTKVTLEKWEGVEEERIGEHTRDMANGCYILAKDGFMQPCVIK